MDNNAVFLLEAKCININEPKDWKMKDNNGKDMTGTSYKAQFKTTFGILNLKLPKLEHGKLVEEGKYQLAFQLKSSANFEPIFAVVSVLEVN